MIERTLTIQGREVTLLYCAATENGFESLTDKPIYEIDIHRQQDLILLGLCAIVASYAHKGEEPPVTSDTLLYEASLDELKELVRNVFEMYAEWYGLPKVVASDLEKESTEAGISEEDARKN